MHVKRLLAVAATGCALVTGVTLPATAGTSHPQAPATHQFKSTIKPSKNVRSGTVLHVKGHGAKKNTQYDCLFVILHKSDYAADIGTITNVKSNKHGKVSCTKTFEPYSAADQNGKLRHCPLTKKDAKARFRCAVVIATTTKSSATVAYFTAHGSKKA